MRRTQLLSSRSLTQTAKLKMSTFQLELQEERYRQGDASYKQTLQNLKRAFAKYHLEPTDEELAIAQDTIRVINNLKYKKAIDDTD